MARPGVCGAVVALMLAASACDAAGPTTVRVLPRDDRSANLTLRAQLVSTEASLTEDLPGADVEPERIAVTITLLNVGEVPVEDVFVRDGRVGWNGGMAMAAAFSRDSASDTSPLAPGEGRDLLFSADVGPLAVCTREALALPNPHHGLVNVALTLLSSAGAWALAGIDAAVTCAGSDDDAAAPARQPTRDVEFLRPID